MHNVIIWTARDYILCLRGNPGTPTDVIRGVPKIGWCTGKLETWLMVHAKNGKRRDIESRFCRSVFQQYLTGWFSWDESFRHVRSGELQFAQGSMIWSDINRPWAVYGKHTDLGTARGALEPSASGRRAVGRGGRTGHAASIGSVPPRGTASWTLIAAAAINERRDKACSYGSGQP